MWTDRTTTNSHFIYEWITLCVGLLTLGSFIAYNQIHDHRRIETQEHERLTIQAQVVEKNLKPQLLLASHVIDGIIDDLPSWQAENDGFQRANHQLRVINDTLLGIRPILIIQSDGKVIASSNETLVGMNFSYREYFQLAVKNPDPKILHVSAPLKTVLGTYVISLFRTYVAPNGTFAGIVIVSVVPEYFSDLLDSVRYAPDMLTTIVHGDGKVFLTSPPRIKGLADMDMAKPGSFFMRHRESGRLASMFTGTSFATGAERMIALRTIWLTNPPMDKALVVTAGRDLEPVFAPLRKSLYVQSIMFAMISILSAPRPLNDQ